MSDFWIRGIAAPFCSWAPLDGKRESFARGAFQLPGSRIDLRVEHDGAPFASTSDKTLQLRQGEHGLMFCALLAGGAWARINEMRRGILGCSVNMPRGYRSREAGVVEGAEAYEITATTIDHVALLTSPAYRETSAWLAHWDLRDLPVWVQEDAARWAQDWSACHTAAPTFVLSGEGRHARAAVATNMIAPLRACRRPRDPSAVWDSVQRVWRRPPSSMAARMVPQRK